MKEQSKSYSRKGAMIAGMVFACSVLAFYVALAPIEQRALLGSNNAPPVITLSHGDKAMGAGQPGREALSDILGAGALAEISQRAVQDVLEVHQGFVPSVIAVADCYQTMPLDDVKQRIFCMQLDRAAWVIEKMAPPAWRAKDAEANDYLTESRFLERQLKYALPLSDSDKLMREKQKFLSVLGAALDAALIEKLEKKWRSNPEETPSHMSGTPT